MHPGHYNGPGAFANVSAGNAWELWRVPQLRSNVHKPAEDLTTEDHQESWIIAIEDGLQGQAWSRHGLRASSKRVGGAPRPLPEEVRPRSRSRGRLDDAARGRRLRPAPSAARTARQFGVPSPAQTSCIIAWGTALQARLERAPRQQSFGWRVRKRAPTLVEAAEVNVGPQYRSMSPAVVVDEAPVVVDHDPSFLGTDRMRGRPSYGQYGQTR